MQIIVDLQIIAFPNQLCYGGYYATTIAFNKVICKTQQQRHRKNTASVPSSNDPQYIYSRFMEAGPLFHNGKHVYTAGPHPH